VLTVVLDLPAALPADGRSSPLIDQIVREGAVQVLAAALRAGAAACVGRFAGVRGGGGHRLVVRGGTGRPRAVLACAGAVEVTAPRVSGKRTGPAAGERMRVGSAVVLPWARKTPRVGEVLPLLCLHVLWSGGLVPALG
jgi:putative transposase